MLELNRWIFTQININLRFLKQNFHIIEHLYIIKEANNALRCIFAGRKQDQKLKISVALPATLDDDANPLSLLSNTPQEKKG